MNILLKSYRSFYLIQNLLILSAALFILSCNQSYEDIEISRTGLHPAKPPLSVIYHGEYFRFPYQNCDEPQCHGSGLKGGNSGAPSCYKCHNDLWSIFYVSHTIPFRGIYHHNAIDNCTTEADYIANCGLAVCHGDGTNILGVSGRGYSCYACHDPLPTARHN